MLAGAWSNAWRALEELGVADAVRKGHIAQNRRAQRLCQRPVPLYALSHSRADLQRQTVAADRIAVRGLHHVTPVYSAGGGGGKA